jgi:hypothetical protein
MSESGFYESTDLQTISSFLDRNPYTAPDGRVFTGENYMEFVKAFFPEEIDSE